MKALFLIVALSFGLTDLAAANNFANDVFEENAEYGLVVGHNTVNGGPCAYQTNGFEVNGNDLAELSYSFDSDHVFQSTISSLNFSKRWFSNRLFKEDLGSLEQIASGDFRRSRLEVDYNDSLQISAIRYYGRDSSLHDECIFSMKN